MGEWVKNRQNVCGFRSPKSDRVGTWVTIAVPVGVPKRIESTGYFTVLPVGHYRGYPPVIAASAEISVRTIPIDYTIIYKRYIYSYNNEIFMGYSCWLYHIIDTIDLTFPVHFSTSTARPTSEAVSGSVSWAKKRGLGAGKHGDGSKLVKTYEFTWIYHMTGGITIH